MSQTWGEFYYNYMQGSVGTTLSNTGFSDMPLPLPFKVMVDQFPEEYDSESLRRYFKRQVQCSAYDGNIFLRVHFLHLSKKRVISDHIESDLTAWVKDKSSSKDNWDADSWWQNIKYDFLLIFKPVCEGLKKMHLKNEYHGRLGMKSGIMVQVCNGKKRGILTHMVDQDEEDESNITTKLIADVEALIGIINVVLEFPFGEGRVPINLGKEVKDLCLSQLKSYSRKSDLTIKWTLDPILFWNTNRRIKFLLAVFWMFYRHGGSAEVSDAAIVETSKFPVWSYNNNNESLSKVYNYELFKDPEKYTNEYSIIKF